MPRKAAPTEPTRGQRAIVALLADSPAFRIRGGWRIRGGQKITAATGATLHAFGLVRRKPASNGGDMMVLTPKGLALAESISPRKSPVADLWSKRADLA